MQFHRSLIVFLLCSTVSGLAFASNEIDSEINDLQVRMTKATAEGKQAVLLSSKKKKKNLKSTKAPAPVWHEYVVESEPVIPPGPPPVPADAPRARPEADFTNFDAAPVTPEPAPEVKAKELEPATLTTSAPASGPSFFKIFKKVTLMPMASFFSFDGDDMSKVIPSSVQNPVTVSPTGTLLVDLDLGLGRLAFQTGVSYMMAGTNTGWAQYQGFSYGLNDEVILNYLGVPIKAKYQFSDSNRNGLYVTGGIIPIFLIGHTYSTYSGQNNEYRFGGYTQSDMLFTASIGYSVNISKHFQAVFDISGFQGITPVFTLYNVYNVGGAAGFGLSYML